jgi:hypothetical protein
VSHNPVAGADHYAAKPAWEAFQLFQIVQRPVCGEERFLGRILGEMKVAKDRVGAAESHVLEAVDDLAERLDIPFECPFEQRFYLFHGGTSEKLSSKAFTVNVPDCAEKVG